MIGDRIHQARKAAGLSLRSLADRAGISAMAISKYENNKSTPSSGVLLSLADALGVRVEYFFRVSNIQLKELEYRKHAKLPHKILAQIEGDVIEQIERFLELRAFLPVSPVESFKLPDNLPFVESYGDVEEVANRIRQAWGLGNHPIADLIDTLEEKGVMVFQSNALHGDKFDGLAARVNEIPVVVVGREWPGDRQRFTLAHEFGHLVLKARLAKNLDEEKAANRFAGAFLVPAVEVIKELGNRRSRLDPVELCVLKSAYGLSMQGWLHRAVDLGVLSKSAYMSMRKLFSTRGWQLREPGDEYPAERPKLFIQLVFRAYAEELISASRAAEFLGQSLVEFRAMRQKGVCEPAAVN